MRWERLFSTIYPDLLSKVHFESQLVENKYNIIVKNLKNRCISNHGDNILEFYNVLAVISFTASKTELKIK